MIGCFEFTLQQFAVLQMTYVKIQKIIHEKTSFLDPLPGVKSNLEYLVDKVREICSLIHIELLCDELPPTSLQHFWGIIKNVTPVAKTNKWDLKNASIGAIMQTIKENDSILHQYKQMIFILKSIVIDLGNDEKYPNAETPTKRNKHNCIDQLNEILSVHKCFQQVFTSVINTSLAQEEEDRQSANYCSYVPVHSVLTNEEIKEACDWASYFAEQTQQQGKFVADKLLRASHAFLRAETQLRLIGDFILIPEKVIEGLGKQIHFIRSYLHGNTTKIELSKLFLSPDLLQNIQIFIGHTKNLQNHIDLYCDEILIGKRVLQGTYQQLFNLKVPILSMDNILGVDLNLFNGTLETTDFKEVRDLWEHKLANNIDHLYQIIEFVGNTMVNPASKIGSKLTSLNESLQIYFKSTKMDTQFFM